MHTASPLMSSLLTTTKSAKVRIFYPGADSGPTRRKDAFVRRLETSRNGFVNRRTTTRSSSRAGSSRVAWPPLSADGSKWQFPLRGYVCACPENSQTSKNHPHRCCRVYSSSYLRSPRPRLRLQAPSSISIEISGPLGLPPFGHLPTHSSDSSTQSSSPGAPRSCCSKNRTCSRGPVLW